MLEHLFLFIASLIANTFSALAGGGAGLLQLPILLFLGLTFGTALATHKVATVALGVGATLRHLKEGALERRFVLFILATGLPGVVIGAAVILQVPDVWARFLLGLLTIGLAVYSFFKKSLGQTAQPNHREGLGLLIGGVGLFLIGFLNGSLTSGTGLFVTLWLVRWFGADYKQAVAYTLVCWLVCFGMAPVRLPWVCWAISVGIGCLRCCLARLWVAIWARIGQSPRVIAASR